MHKGLNRCQFCRLCLLQLFCVDQDLGKACVVRLLFFGVLDDVCLAARLYILREEV